jgi:hypothetical protein
MVRHMDMFVLFFVKGENDKVTKTSSKGIGGIYITLPYLYIMPPYFIILIIDDRKGGM